MNLSKTNLLARFYNYTYDTYLPNNLCNFFWKMVAAVILLPITILSVWTVFIGEDMDLTERFATALIEATVVIVAFGLFMSFYTIPVLSLMLFGGLAIIALIIYFIYRIRNKENSHVNEVIDVVKERIKGFKEGYCPRINWTD